MFYDILFGNFQIGPKTNSTRKKLRRSLCLKRPFWLDAVKDSVVDFARDPRTFLEDRNSGEVHYVEEPVVRV